MKSYFNIRVFISDDVKFSCKDLEDICADFETVTDIILNVDALGLLFEGASFHRRFTGKDIEDFQNRWEHILLSIRIRAWVLDPDTESYIYYKVIPSREA